MPSDRDAPEEAVERRALQLAIIHARAAQGSVPNTKYSPTDDAAHVGEMSIIDLRQEFTTRLMTSGALPVVMHMINRGGLLPPTDERQRAMAAILQVWDGDAQPPSPLPVALASAPMFDLHFISMQLRHVFPNATLTEMSERQIRGAFDGLLLKTRLLPIEPTLQDRISAVSLSLTMESAQGTLKGSPGERLAQASPRGDRGAGTPRSPGFMSKLDQKQAVALPLPTDGSFDEYSAAPLRPGQLEIELWKSPADAERSWGLVLCYPADASIQGVVISELDPEGLVSVKGFALEPGDFIHAVDGIPITILAQAHERLGGSYAKIIVSKAGPLPQGWVMKKDKKSDYRPYYVYARALLATYSHPNGRLAHHQKGGSADEHAPAAADVSPASPNHKGMPALRVEATNPAEKPLNTVLTRLPSVILTEPFHDDFLRLNLRHALPMANVYVCSPEQLRGAFDQLLVRAGLLLTATANQDIIECFLQQHALAPPAPPPLSSRVMEVLAPPKDQQLTIRIAKSAKKSSWGMTLTRPADASNSVVISELDPTGLAAASNSILPGDRIDAIDGTQISSRAEAIEQLRAGEAHDVVLTITRTRGLPDGWMQRRDKSSGRPYFIHARTHTATFAHPSGRAAWIEMQAAREENAQDPTEVEQMDPDWLSAVRRPKESKGEAPYAHRYPLSPGGTDDAPLEVDEGVDEKTKAAHWKKVRQQQLREDEADGVDMTSADATGAGGKGRVLGRKASTELISC